MPGGTKAVLGRTQAATRWPLAVIRDFNRQRSAASEALRSADIARERLAADLHDGIAQHLVSVLAHLSAAEHALHGGDGGRAVLDLNSAIHLLRATVDETRQAIHGLRSPAIDECGLASALRHLMRHSLPASIDQHCVCDNVDLPGPVQQLVYRLAQEALANIRRHASARRVEVSLRDHGADVNLVVSDDGCGFEPTRLSGASGCYGLTSMRLRAMLLGGQLSISSAPGAGTTVALRIPR